MINLGPGLTDFYCNGHLVEGMRSYRDRPASASGGFHPVLGDIFPCPSSDRPRYRVLRKLGQEDFSTVWPDMATDHEHIGVA